MPCIKSHIIKKNQVLKWFLLQFFFFYYRKYDQKRKNIRSTLAKEAGTPKNFFARAFQKSRINFFVYRLTNLFKGAFKINCNFSIIFR